MSRQPLLILVICFILGILFQDYYTLNFSAQIGILSGALCFVVFFVFGFKTRFFFRNIAIMLLFGAIGSAFHYVNTVQNTSVSLKQNEIIVFKITRKLNSTEKFKKYEAQAEAGKQSFATVLNIPKANKELDFNHYYKSKAFVVQPKSPEHNFMFDYSQYLGRKGIAYQCFIKDEIYSIAREDLSFNEKLKQKRLETLEKINHAGLSPRTREFLKGMILADRTETDAVTVQDFNRSGLMHFLAISGTHIVVIFGLFYFLLMKFSPVGFRKYAVALSLASIWIFAVFIGMGNSVFRACIMISVYFVYVLLQRKTDLLHAMALSAFIILMLDSQQIFDVGFQLSFSAVLGIFLLNKPVLKWLPATDTLLKKIVFNTFSVTISAQLATLPLVLYYFHQFSPVSLVANLFIVPFSEIVIVFSLLMTLLISVNLDFHVLNFIYNFIIEILLDCIHWFAGFEDLFYENIAFNWWEVLVAFVFIYFLKLMLSRFNVKTFAHCVMAFMFFLMIRLGFDIDADQQDEVLVHHYNKKSLLSVKENERVVFWVEAEMDREKVTRFIINPYLASRRIEKVEVKTLPPRSQAVAVDGVMYDLD